MNKRSPKNSLKGLSWSYIFLAALAIIGMIIWACIPDVADKFTEVTGDKNSFMELEVGFAVNALIYLWYFWLARRVVNGKSKGTFYMILLAIGVIGGIGSFFAGYSKAISTVDFVIDCVALYFLVQVRNEAK